MICYLHHKLIALDFMEYIFTMLFTDTDYTPKPEKTTAPARATAKPKKRTMDSVLKRCCITSYYVIC